MGIRHIHWHGGDPLLHPDWFEIVNYATDRGIHNVMVLSGVVSERDVERLLKIDCTAIGIHIDTINQDVYNQVHRNPRTLEQKIRTYKNLLNAGYPADQFLP